MTILLSVNGVPYNNFTTANAKIALDELSGTFNFTAISTQGASLPFVNGNSCEILVNNTAVITGFIESIQIGYSANQHRITVQGRDRTADVIDSTITGVKLSPPLSLKVAIETVLQNIGNTLIEVKEEISTDNFNKAEEKLNGKIGQNAFSFIESLARKRQRLLTRDGLGNIVITQGSGIDIGGAVQNIIGSNSNNILERNAYTFYLS